MKSFNTLIVLVENIVKNELINNLDIEMRDMINSEIDECKKIIQQSKKPNPFSNTALITPEYYRGVQEWYMPVIECPKCNHKTPASSNFCIGCGVKIKLSTTVKNYSKSNW